jgi:hypothetical protein
MNTKIIAPPLANSITMGLAAAVFLASVNMAAAQERYPAGANQYYGMYEPAQRALSFSRGDRFRYGHSGTRGRDGLGASSVYPEGPGNVSD